MKRYNLTKIEILLIEENSFMRRLMRGILRELGIRHVRDADNFDIGFKIFQENDLDLIFTNWAPDLDVLEFLKMARRSAESPNPEVPIIVVTAFTEVNHVLAARDHGTNEFLAKPVSAEIVYQRICNVIEGQRPFIRVEAFVGPDRRRKSRPISHEERRGKGPPPEPPKPYVPAPPQQAEPSEESAGAPPTGDSPAAEPGAGADAAPENDAAS